MRAQAATSLRSASPLVLAPNKIRMYLKRYHDVEISSSGVWRILRKLDMNRLPSSQRYKRLDKRYVR
jgi:transposase